MHCQDVVLTLGEEQLIVTWKSMLMVSACRLLFTEHNVTQIKAATYMGLA